MSHGTCFVILMMSWQIILLFQDVCMPVMDGLQATRIIRSFEETGNWDAAARAGIEQVSSDLSCNGHSSTESRERVPIIAVSTCIGVALAHLFYVLLLSLHTMLK